MPTVSLNEWGVVVRGCVSSTPSILTSRSLDSVADGKDGKGADIGVNDEYGRARVGSPVPDPNANGDSVSLISLCGFSNSSGVGLLRFFFPEDDSEPLST